MRRKSSCLSSITSEVYGRLISARYAYFKKLDYFSTECIYSPDAYRGHARTFLKDLEAARPSAIIDIIHSGEAFEVREDVKAKQKPQRKAGCCVTGSREVDNFSETCKRCGYMSSNELCKACTLLEGLERGMANSVIVSPTSPYRRDLFQHILHRLMEPGKSWML
jgi:tRNA(Ile)-lysidine synthase TilS/MesJ